MRVLETIVSDTYLAHVEGGAHCDGHCLCDVVELPRAVPIVRVRVKLQDVAGDNVITLDAGQAWKIAQLQARLEWGA
jgi:hypothetical protein